MEAIEMINKNGLVGKIGFDDDPESPRDWDGNYGTIYHTHPRYDLGERVENHNEALYRILRDNDELKAVCEYCADELEYSGYGWESTTEDEEPDECKSDDSPVIQHPGIATIQYKLHRPVLDGAHIFPLYAYEHGGITISMGAYSDPWDSGQVGIIATTDKRIAEGGFVPTDEYGVKELLEDEVKAYAQYLEGMIYRYEITTGYGGYVSSCGGYSSEEDCKSEMLAEMEG